MFQPLYGHPHTVKTRKSQNYICDIIQKSGKRTLGISSRAWENNIKLDSDSLGGSRLDCLAQDGDKRRAYVNTVMKLRIT